MALVILGLVSLFDVGALGGSRLARLVVRVCIGMVEDHFDQNFY